MCAVATPESVQAIPSPMSSCSGSMCAEKPRCPICGDVSHNKHFGIWSCNACSAFFRRTISKSRRYTCVKGKACSISYADARHICRYCRFERCIKLGMNIQSVFVRSTDEYRHFDADSPLRQILLAQRATFVNRYASLLKHYGNDPSRVKMGAECPSLSRTVVIVASEFSVLTEYLLTSGFKELGLTDLELQALAKCLFYPWMAFHSIMGVLRNAGHKTNG
ncbi:Nuclear receptor domain-containing protein [Aphelenchoides fujianensis]|nr:Nuclear receptor domain-containing protein [Aphelenchoides fujianensis]